MCDPVTLTYLAIGALGAIDQDNKAQDQYDAQAESAQAAADQDAAAKTTQQGERIKQGRIERARIQVAGGESGAAGASFEATLRDSFFQQNEDTSLIRKQGELDGKSIQAQARANNSQVNSVSPLGAAVQIGGAGLQGYNSGLQIKGG
jgi:hypothetical protein